MNTLNPYNLREKAKADKRKVRIKARFHSSGLSRREFAEKLGMSRQNLERLIKGDDEKT